jgi:macrolide transport system ATP-binding/permease protein
MRLLKELNAEGRTIIIVTHDMNVARNATRIYHMLDGVLNESEWADVAD